VNERENVAEDITRPNSGAWGRVATVRAAIPGPTVQGARTLDKIYVLSKLPGATAAGRRWQSFGSGCAILSTQSESTDVFFLASGRVRITI